MSDLYKIDNHKLIYHPARVVQWLEAGNDWNKFKKIYPIYVEISPYGGCNHRCSFCAVDYIGYQNVKWDANKLKVRLSEMALLGIKAVMFAGEGEPLLWNPLIETLEHCKSIGIEASLTSNFVPTSKTKTEGLVRNLSWIKISINAGTAKTYGKIHVTCEKDFNKVLSNIKVAVAYKKKHGLNCAIGAQMLLLPENKDEALVLAKIMKKLGVDYVVIKPYSQHLFSHTKKYQGLTYESMMDLEKELLKLNNKKFNVIFRSQTMNQLSKGNRVYQKCYSTPFFWSYIMADGSLYGCSCYLKQEKFCYGSLNESTFQELWESDKRKQSIEYIKNELDIRSCRINCRMNAINEYLWQLKHPSAHVNFI